MLPNHEGQRVPQVTFRTRQDGQWKDVTTDQIFKGRNVVVFALPGMVLATIFVSLPFVVREVVPVLREIGTEQEQAAATLGASTIQTFMRVTWPAIRWAASNVPPFVR